MKSIVYLLIVATLPFGAVFAQTGRDRCIL